MAGCVRLHNSILNVWTIRLRSNCSSFTNLTGLASQGLTTARDEVCEKSGLGIVPNLLMGQTEPRPAKTLSHARPIPREITIDGEVTLFTKEGYIGHTMPQMKRHPAGEIYVNGYASGLF